MADKGIKRLGLPLVIMLVLVAVAVLATDPFGWFKPAADHPDENAPKEIKLCSVTADTLTGFEIDQISDEPFQLLKEGGQWFVVRGDARYKANMERIDKLIEDVPGLMSSGLATNKADKQATFEVDDAQAIRLKVFAGGETPAVDMYVGKATPSFDGAFVRLANQDEVYRAAKNIKSLVGFSFRDFRSKEPWKFEPATLASVTIAPPDGEGEALTFTRAEGFWKTPEGTNGNQNLITELLDKISKLKANDFVDEPDPELTGLEGREPNLVLDGPEGELTLTIGLDENSQYFVQDQDGNVYKISEYNLKPYRELAFAELTFDDTAPVAAEGGDELSNAGENPDEGITGDLPSDADEG
ncbi:DUF4340 domain-containing protein [bacterium]|nr:DUF4340 domain-containing protein [bacterium]